MTVEGICRSYRHAYDQILCQASCFIDIHLHTGDITSIHTCCQQFIGGPDILGATKRLEVESGLLTDAAPSPIWYSFRDGIIIDHVVHPGWHILINRFCGIGIAIECLSVHLIVGMGKQGAVKLPV